MGFSNLVDFLGLSKQCTPEYVLIIGLSILLLWTMWGKFRRDGEIELLRQQSKISEGRHLPPEANIAPSPLNAPDDLQSPPQQIGE